MIGADDLRAGHTDRDETVRSLQGHYQAGRLSVAELEERTAKALVARTLGDLRSLLADLPDDTPAAAKVPEHLEGPGRAPNSRRLGTFLCVAGSLTVVWLAGGHGYYWPIWPIFGCLWMVAGPRPRRRRRRRVLSRL
jgi:hypothetical protein